MGRVYQGTGTMGTGTPKVNTKPKRRFVVTRRFKDKLNEVQEIGYQLFGKNVAISFRERILERVVLVKEFPEMYPLSRFIQSTDKKQYRNIIIEKYYVIYSVTKTTIRIITIIHQATDSKTIAKIK